MKTVFVLCAFLALSKAIPTSNEIPVDDSAWSLIGREMGKCLYGDDAINCITLKGVTALRRASRMNSLEVVPGVSLVRETPVNQRDGKALNENEIEANLPQGPKDRTARLIDMLVESVFDFMSTHTLKMKLPENTSKDLARAFEEGRGKMKKFMMGHMMMMGLGAKAFLVLPLMLFGIKLLAFKALVIAKIALVIALVVGIPSLLSGAGGGSSLFGGKGGSDAGYGSYGPPSSGGWSGNGGSYGYARTFSEDAHDIAYSAQAPTN